MDPELDEIIVETSNDDEEIVTSSNDVEEIVTPLEGSASSQLSDLDVLQEEIMPLRPMSENEFTYTRKEFDDIFADIGEENPEFTGDDILQSFAESQAQEISSQNYPDNPEYINYACLVDMTCPILDDIPGFDNLRLQRVEDAKAKGPMFTPRLSDRDIISLFARDEEGAVIESPTNMEGFGRAVKENLFGSILASGSFWGGVKITNKVLSNVRPRNLPTAIVRAGGPVVMGILSMISGKMAGDEVTEEVLDATNLDTKAFIPGLSDTGYYAGQLFTDVLSFAPVSFAVSKNIDLGSKLAIQIAENAGTKIPKSARVMQYMEKMLVELGENYRGAPFKFGTVEGVAGATSISLGSAMYETDRDAELARLGVEMAGGITSGGLANFGLNKVLSPTGKKYLGLVLKKAFTQSPKKSFKEAVGAFTKTAGEKTENAVGAYIIKVIKESGEDLQEIIRRLESDEFTKIVNASGGSSGLPLIDPVSGEEIALTASMKTGSIALAALERAIAKSSAGLGTERSAANLQVQRTLRNVIVAMYSSGDKTATQEAAELMNVVFTNSMEGELKDSITKMVQAFQRVKGGKNLEVDGVTLDQESSKVLLSQKLNKFLTDKNDEFRTESTRLWNRLAEKVGTLRLRNFRYTGPEGEDLGTGQVPNFIKSWRKIVPLIGKDGENQSYKNITLNYPGLKELENFVQRIEKELADAANPKKDAVFKGISFMELQNMRNAALSIARNARSGSDPNDLANKIATSFQKGLLKDLDSLPETELFKSFEFAGNPQNRELQMAYDAAKQHTLARKQAFNLTFLGKVFKRNSQGSLNIDPEELINTILKSDTAYIKTAQLDAIGKFELNQNLAISLDDSLKGRGGEVLDDVLIKTIDSETGFFDIGLLQTYLAENAGKLKDFPEAVQAIKTALNSSTTSRGIVDLALRRLKSETFPKDADLQAWLVNADDNPKIALNQLATWMQKENNQELLRMFPDLKKDLENLDVAKALLDENSLLNKARTEKLKDTLSFKNLLYGITENPSSEITKALRNANATKEADLDGLFKAIKEAPESWSNPAGEKFTKAEALEGFKSSIMEAIMNRGGMNQSTFLPSAMYQTLFKELPNTNNFNLSKWMQKNGLFKEEDVTNLKSFLGKMMEVEAFATVGGSADDLDSLATRVGPAIDLYLRVAGSQAGANLQKLLPGSSGAGTLVAAGAGSKAFRSAWQKTFAHIPDSLKQDFMQNLFKNPKKLALLLRKTNTAEKTQSLASIVLNGMFKDGLAVPRRNIPLVVNERDAGSFNEAINYLIESVTPWNEETDQERIRRERLELQDQATSDRVQRENSLKKQRINRENILKKQRIDREKNLRTSFLQRPSDGNPPTTPTGPASGPSTSSTGTRFSAMSEGEKYDALFGNSGIGSLMS